MSNYSHLPELVPEGGQVQFHLGPKSAYQSKVTITFRGESHGE